MVPGQVFPDEQERWRNEVASRLTSYKARRRRKVEGDYSMKLDFEAAEPVLSSNETAQLASAVAEQKVSREICDTNYYRRANAEVMGYGAANTAVAVAPAPLHDDLDADFDFLVRREEALEHDEERDPARVEPNTLAAMLETSEAPTAELDASAFAAAPGPAAIPPSNNLILFPRPTIEPPLAPPPTTRDELAERVFERPRILDVPEDNAPTIQGPLFADIHLDNDVEDSSPVATPTVRFEIPLQVAPVMQRAFAGACDWAIVLAASGVFFLLTWKSIETPLGKSGMALMAMVPIALWSIYQFLFHLYAAQTPGMEFAHLRLSDFHRDLPDWDKRRRRAFYATLSCLSVGFGFLWALVDEDTLCWHDRASHTYLTEE